MKAKTKHLADQITQALGPIFRETPDYKTISEAISLTVARVAQSTPDKGDEIRQLDKIHDMAFTALEQFLNEEEALLEAKAKVLAKGVDGFAEMYGPVNGLAAINGGVSPEACAEAEEFAGRFHDDKGRLTEEGFEQLKKDVIALHTPDTKEGSWSNSPIHQEMARFEQEHPELRNGYDDGYNPDGPRAYAP